MKLIITKCNTFPKTSFYSQTSDTFHP